MVVEIVSLHPYRCFALTILFIFEINDSPLEPASRGMVRIDAVIDLNFLSGLPLRKNAI